MWLSFDYPDTFYPISNKTKKNSMENFNNLTQKIDKHLVSPYNVTPESFIKVMRIKEMIPNLWSSWLLNKFSLSVP